MNIKELAGNLGLEEEEYLELVELFIDRGRSDLDELQAALGAGDVEKVASAAHSLKGAAGNLGFVEIYKDAAMIESQALGKSMEGSEALMRSIIKNVEKIALLIR